MNNNYLDEGISFMATKAEKEKWKKVAKSKGLTLSQLFRNVMNAYTKAWEEKQKK